MALASKLGAYQAHNGQMPVSKVDMPWPTVASHLASNANRPSIKAAFEEKNTSAFGNWEEIGAQSLRAMWRHKMRPKRKKKV
jgi:hypothetical protein